MVNEILSRKNKAFKNWIKEKTKEAKKEYDRLLKKAKNVVQEEKKKWMDECTRMIEYYVKGNKKVLYAIIKGRKEVGENEKVDLVRNQDKKDLSNREELQGRMGEVFRRATEN